MLFSRFWYVVLALVALVGFSFTFFTSTAFNRKDETTTEDVLFRDQQQIELLLEKDARARIDAIAPIAADQAVRSSLRSASSKSAPTWDDALTSKLRQLNSQLNELAGIVLFTVDKHGNLVGGIGVQKPTNTANFSAVPFVDRALAGYMRDDVWVFRDQVYRIAARPVIDGGEYVGAVVHGMKFDDALARRLSNWIQPATLTFFHGPQKTLGKFSPSAKGAVPSDSIKPVLGDALGGVFKDGKRSEVLEVSDAVRGIVTPIRGDARGAQVGYAIMRSLTVLGPTDVFTQLRKNDELPPSIWGLLGGGALLAILLGFFGVWFERDRPLKRLKADTAGMTGAERLSPGSYSGAYRDLAIAINESFERAASGTGGAPLKQPQDIAAILGENPEDTGQANALFGFAGGAQNAAPAAPPAPAAKHSGGSLMDSEAPIATRIAESPQLPPIPPAVAPPPAAAAAPAAAKPPAPKLPPPPSIGKPPPAPAPAASFDDDEDDFDEPATMVAQIPEKLLESAANKMAGMSQTDQEETHFREVYDRFIVTKKKCGEPTQGVTFDRFVQTLRRNRDVILSKHDASNVHFTVYVKDGKAALKATPVK